MELTKVFNNVTGIVDEVSLKMYDEQFSNMQVYAVDENNFKAILDFQLGEVSLTEEELKTLYNSIGIILNSLQQYNKINSNKSICGNVLDY